MSKSKGIMQFILAEKMSEKKRVKSQDLARAKICFLTQAERTKQERKLIS